MCYQKCRYEDYSGECTLKRDAIPPMDAMCTINDTAAENAMLRELVRDMWLYDYAGFFTTLREASDHREEVYQRIRKLGIEVGE